MGDELDLAIAKLNELLAIDPEAISKLVGHRVHANQGLVDHPTASCGLPPQEERTVRGGDGAPLRVSPSRDAYTIGMLGVLNAIFGRPGEQGPIAVRLNDDGSGDVEYFLRLRPRGLEGNPLGLKHPQGL